MDSQGLVNWIGDNIVTVILAFIGLLIILGARKGNWGKEMSVVALALVGLVVFVNGPELLGLADELGNVVFG